MIGRLAPRGGAYDAFEKSILDALVYPTVRRIAPVIGGNQAGSNAGLSAQTGCPAISGVAQVLTKQLTGRATRVVTLLDAERADLKAGL